jgi:hypothetical protein
VQPLLQRDAPGAEQLANTEREIALAERFAAGQGISAADIGDPALSSPPSGAARAAYYASRAAEAAAIAPYAARVFAEDAARAARSAAQAAAGNEAAFYADYAARHDYERLLAQHRGMSPVVDEPIDCSEDGPLGPCWPEGRPTWLQEHSPAENHSQVA